jgi:hypothetical protein
MIVAVDWTSGTAILLLIAGAIGTLGTAGAIVLAISRSARSWLRPPKPLIAFGHPVETPTQFALISRGFPAKWELQKQLAAREEIRLSSLSVSYLIENKDAGRGVRELRTGIRERGGLREHTFDECFVLILGAGEKLDVPNVKVPESMSEKLTSLNRAEEFVYWATFADDRGRRWEANYDPKPRKLEYRLLRR